MMKLLLSIAGVSLAAVIIYLGSTDSQSVSPENKSTSDYKTSEQSQDTLHSFKVEKTEQEWKKILTDDQYHILREGGTELPFINKYWNNKKEGIYYCAACGNPLFSSKAKYESGTGWPSFWKPVSPDAVKEREDKSLFMTRTEIICAVCGSHIGHVFDDGPPPTGLRYCMNSTALNFKPSSEKTDSATAQQ